MSTSAARPRLAAQLLQAGPEDEEPASSDPSELECTGFVASVIQNRAGEVGLAALDLSGMALHLSQFAETSRSYTSTL